MNDPFPMNTSAQSTQAPPSPIGGGDPLVVQLLSNIELRYTEILKKLDTLLAIEQHLTMLGNQMDAVQVLQSRSFSSGISPQTRLAGHRAEADRAKQEQETEENRWAAVLKERENRGIGNGGLDVTEEDLREADEFYMNEG